MADLQLTTLSAQQLTRGYRGGDFTESEVVAACAEAMAAWEHCNAFITTTVDEALAAARMSERRRARGLAPRPLEGVPIVVKDAFDTAGARTTYGSAMFADRVPATDAAAVARVRAAGAILMGKTLTHEFCWGVTSVNPHFGPCRNPWDVARIAGGSSGGSAVAVATGAAPLALGTDTAGSVRIPAAFCGVAGFKPTYGRIDRSGVVPLSDTLDHVGGLARSPADLALLDAVLAGENPPAGDRGASVESIRGMRIAWTAGDADTEPSVSRAVADAIRVFEALGASTVEHATGLPPQLYTAFPPIQLFEAVRNHRALGTYPARTAEYGADVRSRLELAERVEPRAYEEALELAREGREAIAGFFADADLYVCPVSGIPPVTVEQASSPDDPRGEALRGAVLPWTAPMNVAGLPAGTVRAGFTPDGMPVGIQVVGPRDADAAVLEACEAFRRATPEVQDRAPLAAP